MSGDWERLVVVDLDQAIAIDILTGSTNPERKQLFAYNKKQMHDLACAILAFTGDQYGYPRATDTNSTRSS